MGIRPERVNGHTGTETRSRLLREAAVLNHSPMRETVTVRRRVQDEGPWVVNCCQVLENYYR